MFGQILGSLAVMEAQMGAAHTTPTRDGGVSVLLNRGSALDPAAGGVAAALVATEPTHTIVRVPVIPG